MVKLTSKQKLEYFRNKALVKQVVMNRLRQSGNLLSGGKAMNLYLPRELRRATLDYDILVRRNGMTPAQAAKRLERDLDSRFGGDYFSSRKGIYPGVHKVISNVTQGEVADYVKPIKVPKHINRDGVKVVTLSYLKQKFKQSLADKESEWRHAKDRDALQRIRLAKARDNAFAIKPVKTKKLKKSNGGISIW